MDDEDYSWVRRTRFSHSVVRSNSGREQFGAFVEQFNRGAALRQKGSASGFKLHGLNMEPGTRLSTSSLPTTSSFCAQPKPKPKDMSSSDAKPGQHAKAVSDRPSSQEASARKEDDAKASNGKKGIGKLSVAVPRVPAVQSAEVESPGALEFSFHPDEQSLKLQRACSSPAPFPRNKTPGDDALTRSSSLSVLGEAPKTKQRARSPLPSRHVAEVFQEAKSATKRFSTPPPPRRSASSLELNGCPPAPVTVRAPGKLKNRKEGHANGRMKVAATALEVLEKWSVDRSQLLIGHRFASGAHSRLFHGIYKEQPVAVKFIRQPDDEEDAELAAQLEKQFHTEVATLSRLNHPNVIKLVGACSSPPVFCVITEFLSGGSLRAFLHKLDHKALPLGKIISISLDIARGMSYIHSQGVVHRDVKPENIIFDDVFCAKIVDFGIACEEEYCDPLANDTGTFRWMAPEMMKHKAYGRKVDVYSFGLILWEMFSGTIPYEELNPFQAAFAVFDKNVRPAIPTSCPTPVRLLIEQCWASHPEKRPDFSQIVQILEKFKSVLDRDGTLDNMPSSICQETHDHKNWLAHWVQRLKHSQPDLSGPPPPKLL
uniref:Protein kinase n=1 Tax=Zea mays TaxID=4577 RepID=B6SVR9_MAIZE|nr:protein kinase [Zea mays]